MSSLNQIDQQMDARARFLYARRSGIGGSDVAAIMGLSKWKSAYQVWEDKLGISDDGYDNDSMLWGRLLEPVIRQHYAQLNGVHVYDIASPLRNPAYPYLVANADGAVAKSQGAVAHKGLEIKTARYTDEWGPEDTDQVPFAYLLQINHYMLVAGVSEWDVAVLFMGSMYRQYTIKANKELQEQISAACEEFWINHVMTGNPPPPTCYGDVVSRFGDKSVTGEVVAPFIVEKAVGDLININSEIKRLEKNADEAKFLITNCPVSYTHLRAHET
jgi:putative phage-type endonuclease